MRSVLGEPKTKAPGRWSYLREGKETINNEAFDLMEQVEVRFLDDQIAAIEVFETETN
ncbi:MAG: hypothetical protein ACT4TC_10815 [Myxococcaceae bacterium]